ASTRSTSSGPGWDRCWWWTAATSARGRAAAPSRSTASRRQSCRGAATRSSRFSHATLRAVRSSSRWTARRATRCSLPGTAGKNSVGSVRHAGRAGGFHGAGVPLQLGGEAGKPPPDRLAIHRRAILAEGALHFRNREQAGNTRHPHLAERGTQLHRRADAAEHPRRIADDRRRLPEILLEEVVQQVHQRRRHRVVVFAGDDHERIAPTV